MDRDEITQPLKRCPDCSAAKCCDNCLWIEPVAPPRVPRERRPTLNASRGFVPCGYCGEISECTKNCPDMMAILEILDADPTMP